MADDDDIPGLDPDILARAEQAVAALGDDFVAQTQDALAAHRERLADGMDGEMLRDLFAFAHDMRGQGGSFGYPLLSEIGESLCHFLEGRDYVMAEDDPVVLQSHLDAAAALLAGDVAGDGDDVSRALVDSLTQLVGKRLGTPT